MTIRASISIAFAMSCGTPTATQPATIAPTAPIAATAPSDATLYPEAAQGTESLMNIVGSDADVVQSSNDKASPRLSVTDKHAFDETSLDLALVVQKIQSSYVSGIRRCYKALLKRDPTARGKLSLAFEVNEVGRVKAGPVTTFADELVSCVTPVIATWRFAAPKDRDGEPTTAAFQITVALVPE